VGEEAAPHESQVAPYKTVAWLATAHTRTHKTTEYSPTRLCRGSCGADSAIERRRRAARAPEWATKGQYKEIPCLPYPSYILVYALSQRCRASRGPYTPLRHWATWILPCLVRWVPKPWANDTVAHTARADVWKKTACLAFAPSSLLQRIRARGPLKATACRREAIWLLGTTSDMTETRGDPNRGSKRLDDRRIV